MTSAFTRRVSFNNLYPDYIDADQASPFKQNYALLFSGSQSLSPSFQLPYQNLDVNRLYLSTPVAALPTGYIHRKKSTKLPDPPSKSILKNKLLPQQRLFNLENSKSLGINYHEDLNDLALHPPKNVPKSELAYTVNDDGSVNKTSQSAVESDSEDSDEDDSPSGSPPAVRRKSYSGMTNEELMALDPQFATTKSKTSNVNQFKFDNQKTYYKVPNQSRKNSSSNGNGKNTVYPSSNENNYKSINLTVKHPDFEVVPNRTLLTVISGRRHSWNSLDWLFNLKTGDSFLENGDYLVVAALIPAKFLNNQNKKNKKRNSAGSIYNPDTDGFLYQKCEKLLDYITDNLPKHLKLKVTVEFITDNTVDEQTTSILTTKKKLVRYKFLFSKLLKQYQPFLVIIGNRSTNLNFKYPVKVNRKSTTTSSISGAASAAVAMLPAGLLQASGVKNGSISGMNGINGGSAGSSNRSSISGSASCSNGSSKNDQFIIKLTSYMIKYFPVPIIIVGNSAKGSFSTSGVEGVTFGNTKLSEEDGLKIVDGGAAERKVSSASIDSNESTVDTVEDLAVEGLSDQVEKLYQSNATSRFKDMIVLVSDTSLKESRAYLLQLQSTSTNGSEDASSSNGTSIKFDLAVLSNSKIHSIYNSTKQNLGSNEPMYKVKSLISIDEEKPAKKKLEKVKSNVSTSTTTSTGSKKDEGKKAQKKTSFWKKIGVKK